MWVNSVLIPKFKAILQLTRLDLPVGSLLLLWPTITALWIVSESIPPLDKLMIFVLGTVLMRSAGCVVNDIADRNIDTQVERTFKRPLAERRLTLWSAWAIFAVLTSCAFGLVLLLNFKTQLLAIAALTLTLCYPLLKRISQLPQLVLGLAFSWGILMAATAVLDTWCFDLAIYLLFVSNFCWTVAYDTLYAMVDRNDDIKLDIGSTAILAGKHVSIFVGALLAITLVLWCSVGLVLELNGYFYLALLVIVLLFSYQISEVRKADNRTGWFKAFKNNIWVGTCLFLGTAFGMSG